MMAPRACPSGAGFPKLAVNSVPRVRYERFVAEFLAAGTFRQIAPTFRCFDSNLPAQRRHPEENRFGKRRELRLVISRYAPFTLGIAPRKRQPFEANNVANRVIINRHCSSSEDGSVCAALYRRLGMSVEARPILACCAKTGPEA
jgi:hypothetical protein